MEAWLEGGIGWCHPCEEGEEVLIASRDFSAASGNGREGGRGGDQLGRRREIALPFKWYIGWKMRRH